MVRVRGGLVALAAALVFCCVVARGAVASSVFLCVPSSAGQAVTSDGNGSGGCAGRAAKVALPGGAADQQTLISILPYVSFDATGVGGAPTIRFSGVNVQIVSRSGTTNGAVNGKGTWWSGMTSRPGPRPGRTT